MDVMYKVKPIFGAEEVLLPTNMYYVKPISDFESTDFIGSSHNSSGDHGNGKSDRVEDAAKSAATCQVVKGKENKVSNEKKGSADGKATPAKDSPKDRKHGKKGRKSNNSGSEQGQSKDDGQSSKENQDGNQKNNDKGDREGNDPIPPIPVEVPYSGNIIGDVIVQDFAIQTDFDYKPLRVLKVINHLRKNFGLKIAVKVHISSTVLVESESNVDEWKMFETFESTILPRQDNQAVVSLIVKSYSVEEGWLNKQPFMILDPHLGTAIYGEVNIARHITRSAAKYCPLCREIYPEDDPAQVELVKDIDETLNEIQKFLFVRDLQDKQARPSIPEIKDKRLKDNTDLDLKLTLDYILLLSLKL